MEQQAMLNRFFEICEGVRLDAKPAHHKGKHHRHADAQGDGQTGAAQPPRPPKDELKMPPCARGILRLLLTEESLNQRTLAKAMRVTAPAVSDAVKKLEQRALIGRTHGELNNEYMITLTEKGRDIAEKVSEKERKHAEKLFCDFTAEELETLHVLMEKMYHNATKDTV